ncbi:MAG: hypothetical protein ALECFALPRED_000529, partial [Alectoria fallacina]
KDISRENLTITSHKNHPRNNTPDQSASKEIMHRNFTALEARTCPSAMVHASWYAQPLLESQHVAVTMMEWKKERWFGHGGKLQETGFPRTPYPSPPMSDGGGCDEHDESDSVCRSSRPRGARVYPKTPYPSSLSSSSMATQESLYGERGIADDTTFPPSSTITTSTLVNGTPHPHTHVNEPTPASAPFSIRQTFSAYPNVDLFDESLKRHGNHYSTHNLAREVAEKIPKRGSRGVCLQDPANLLQRRLSERRRQQRKPDFSKTVLVHEYDQGHKDMPMRPGSTMFHDDDDGESEDAGPWPRNKFTSRNSKMDSKFYWQAYGHEASMKRLRYDSEKKDYVWTTLEEAKDLSGKEERMREKAKAKREEKLREEVEAEGVENSTDYTESDK